jgi:hypothetical protein
VQLSPQKSKSIYHGWSVFVCFVLSRFRGVTTDGSMDWILDSLTPLETTSNYSATSDLHNLQFTIVLTKPFPTCRVFTSRSLAAASNSGDSSVSRAQVLPSPTLVRNCLPANPSTNWIAISSEPPLHSILFVTTELSMSLMLRPTVSRPVYLGIKYPSEAYDKIFLLSDSCGFVDVGRSLWREDWSVV